MKRAVLILNPAAGSGRRQRVVHRIVAVLEDGGYSLELLPTSGPGNATTLARTAANQGVDAVFAYGGDGTLREVASGLLGTRVPVGFLPAGTANVMARAVGSPSDPIRAAAALCSAPVREIDVGLCGTEPFLMQASCGLDAHVLAHLARGLKRRFGRLGIGLATLPAFWRYTYPEIELAVDGRVIRCFFAAVCNIPFYGGRWRLLPEARPDDRRLDLLVLRGRGRRATMAFALDLFVRRRHHLRHDVEVLPVECVEILRPSPIPLQIDGDPLPATPPVEIRLSPERLRILAPRLVGDG